MTAKRIIGGKHIDEGYVKYLESLVLDLYAEFDKELFNSFTEAGGETEDEADRHTDEVIREVTGISIDEQYEILRGYLHNAYETKERANG